MKCKNKGCVHHRFGECKKEYSFAETCFGHMPPKTNADRIRAMSDDELAELFRWDDCCTCIANGFCNGNMYNTRSCKDIIIEWLNKEIQDAD